MVRHVGVRAGHRAAVRHGRRQQHAGAGFANFDLSVFRDFGLGGGRAVQFRMEIFNLTLILREPVMLITWAVNGTRRPVHVTIADPLHPIRNQTNQCGFKFVYLAVSA